MRNELEVLYSEEQLAAAVKRLAEEITRDYKGKDLAVVGILKGSFIFLADLVREIQTDCTVDFLGVSCSSGSWQLPMKCWIRWQVSQS